MASRDPLHEPKPLIRSIYAYIAYRVGDGPEAEDLTSEVFERAVRYRSSYDRRKGEPIAWLVGIAHRVLKDAAAERGRTAVTPLEPTAEGVRSLEDDVIDRLSLGDALAQMGEHDRHLLALRYGADLSSRQIAAILGIGRGAIDVALHRARERLARILERNDEAARKKTVSAAVDVSRDRSTVEGSEAT
jgi:RNA polymerase sigma-70 factor (ECF subfamily)